MCGKHEEFCYHIDAMVVYIKKILLRYHKLEPGKEYTSANSLKAKAEIQSAETEKYNFQCCKM